MARGGARVGAGRPAGSINKRSAELVEKVEGSGITPLDFMLSVLRDENRSTEDRMWAAEKAAPYVHARLAAIDVSGGATVLADISEEPLSEDEWASGNPVH